MRIGVTGTPGTGKTTFSKELSRRLNLKYVNIEDIIIQENLHMGFDESRDSYILDIERAYKRMLEIAESNTVYEGLSLAYLADEEWLDKIIILRCNPYILEKRLAEKGFKPEKIKENIASEILDVIPSEVYSRFNRENVLQIDNSKDLEKAVEKAVRFINGEDVESDYVDWLGLIAEKNDIKRFLD